MNAITEVKADHKNIFAALSAAQAEMGPALKDAMNPAFRSKYADLSSVMGACLPALTKHGICVMQPTGEDETGRFVRTVLAHVSGETVECKVPLIVSKNDMQGYGSAVTYARRYGLMSMAGIAPEDDDGNAAAKAPPVVDERPAIRGTSAVDVACESLGNADSLERLSLIWKDLPRSIQGDSRVIKAKDDAKARLTPKATDLGGDEIPY